MYGRIVEEAENLPQVKHWVILLFDRYYSDDGYSKSEGGGTYAHPYVRYYAYASEDEWKKELQILFAQDPGRKDVQALAGVVPAQLSIGLTIK